MHSENEISFYFFLITIITAITLYVFTNTVVISDYRENTIKKNAKTVSVTKLANPKAT